MATDDSQHLAQRKRELRAEVRARRRDRSDRQAVAHASGGQQAGSRAADAAGVAAAALALIEALGQLPTDTVAIYASLPTEPPTEHLARVLHDRGFRIIVPHLLPDKDLDWQALSPERDGQDRGDLLGRCAIEEASLIVVPALALDHDGGRLGQGGGSYDRALTRRHPRAVVAGVVFDDEVSAQPVPGEAHDQRVDVIVTTSGRWRARRDLDLG